MSNLHGIRTWQHTRPLAGLAAAVAVMALIAAPASAAEPLQDGVCHYDNSSPKSFSFTQSRHRWAVIAVNPGTNDDKNLTLWRNSAQIQVPLATSSYAFGTDYVIGDFHHNARTGYVADISGGGASAPYRVLWDSGGELTVGTPVSGTIGAYPECGMIRVWDVHLLAGRTYRFTLTKQGSSAAHLVLHGNPASAPYWGGRGDGEFEILANGAPQTFMAPATDDYGVVIYIAQQGVPAGSFTLLVEDITPCSSVPPSDCNAYAGGLPRCLPLLTSAGSWVGYAVAPAPGDTKDICAYTGTNGSGDQLACSVSSGTNFVVGDYNHYVGPPGALAFPLVSGGSSSATYVAQWEGGQETIAVGDAVVGDNISGGNSGDCGLFEVYDLALGAGRAYKIIAIGGPDVRVALFRNPGQGIYWTGRSDAEFEIAAVESFEYTAPTSGDYAVVVFTEDLSATNQSFSLIVVPLYPLAEGSCEGSGTVIAGYPFSQTRHHWAAFAAKANVLAPTGGVRLFAQSSIIFTQPLVGTQLSKSSFVVGDFNHNQTGEYAGIVVTQSQPSDHVADWDPGGVLELGAPVHGSLGQAGNSCTLIKVRDVALEEGRCYRVTLGASGGVAARVALFENPTAGAYWAADEQALVDLAAAQTPYIFTADRTDVYGVAVYDDSFGAASGDYTLEVVGLDAGCMTDVELTLFDAAPAAESIALRWRTGVETDHLGFRLLRATAAATGAGGAAGDGAESDAESAAGAGGAGDAGFEPIGPQLIRPAGGSQASTYTYVDDDPTLEPGVTYSYLLEAIDLQGGVQTFGPLRASLAPLAASPGMTRLAAAQPNPFFERTQLHYQLEAPGPVELVIYDVRGRVVRALERAYRAAGQYDVTWDGRSDQGAALPSGIYFGRLVAGNTADRVKLLLVR